MPVTATGDVDQSRQQLLQAEYELTLREGFTYAQTPITYTPANAILTDTHRFSSAAIPFYFDMAASTAAISQTADISPSTFGDNVFSVSVAEYGDVLQLSEILEYTAATDIGEIATRLVTNQALHSIDRLARSAAVTGDVVAFGGDAATRATVSPLSSADTITENDFLDAAVFLQSAPKIPGWGRGAGTGLAAALRTATLGDLIESSAIIYMAEYGQRPDFLLNGEVGMHMTGVRLVQSEFAKIFQGAGASAAASTGTLSGTSNVAGSTKIQVDAMMSSVIVGQYYALEAIESTANGENLKGETVLVTATGTSAAISVAGAGVNGGLWFNHSSGTNQVTHAYQVYATVFFGAESILKAYAAAIGPQGQVLADERIGNLRQFWSRGWKWIGGFGVPSQNRLYRVEHAASRFTIGPA